IMDNLNPPEGVGFIVRTAAVDRDETELRNDLVYLLRLWQVVVRRIKRPGPVEVYRESDMITRTIRDIFTADIDTIYVDEETAFQMNLKAAKEIARQLRLRDLGGVIVNDFIDMRAEHHRRQVEDTLKNALRRDKARTKTLRVSEFGIIEMTRQRMQPSLKK